MSALCAVLSQVDRRAGSLLLVLPYLAVSRQSDTGATTPHHCSALQAGQSNSVICSDTFLSGYLNT